MSFTSLATLSFAVAAVLALVVLYWRGPQAWYLHVLSVVVGVAIGLTPTPTQFNKPQTSIIVGVPLVFLVVWGLAAPFFLRRRRSS
jgi:uncharacterized membrane protein AbrB (regulator of aidB expression)